MFEYFWSAATAPGPLKGERLQRALVCLNPARVDPEVWNDKQADYVQQLLDILKRLRARGYFDPRTLSDDPVAEPAAIGKDPVLIVLERVQRTDAGGGKRWDWQFSAQSVADIPRMYKQLGQLLDQAETEPSAAEQSVPVATENRLRSPYHMVEYFLVTETGAEKNPALYRDAARCLDFSLVKMDDPETQTPVYVDDLAAIITYLIDEGSFRREQLPKEPDYDKPVIIKSSKVEAVQLIIVRQDDFWRFSSQTVQAVPQMVEAIQKAATAEKGGGAARVALKKKSIPLDTSSPAATLNLFLTSVVNGDLDTAATCFDTTGLPHTDPAVLRLLAGKLLMILNRHEVIVLREIQTPPDGRLELLKHPAGRIEIIRRKGEDGEERWLFSTATVRSIDRLYEAYENKPILPEFRNERIGLWTLPSLYVREYVVPPSLKRRVWRLQLWQWLGLALTLLVGVLVRQVCVLVLPPIVRQLLSSQHAMILPATVIKGLRPTFTLVMLGVWSLGLQILDFGAENMNRVWWFLRIASTIVAVAAAYRLIDLVTASFTAWAAQTKSRLDDVLVPLVQKTLKVVAVAIGGIVIANAFGFNVGPLLAGLGVGGLAFGLAAQDTLKNFFGSVNVVLDRPFQVGDWVRIGDTEGTVEAVGLRSSRIRTFYNSEITIPNSHLMTTAIDNMGRRRYRRTSTKLGVLYSTTPEQLEAFCEGIRELIRTHPYTRKDYYHVYVSEFADSSINILLYCFHECPDWGTELRERQRLYLDILRLAQRLGVEFAFPTRTLHLYHESSPDSSPPSPPPVPGDWDAAEEFGRKQARDLAREFAEHPGERPPPVTY